jgi:hypothetical protein
MYFDKDWECGTCQTTVMFDQTATEVIVQSRTSDNVTVSGTEVNNLMPGMFLIYLNTLGICKGGSPLFRKINSITNGTDGEEMILSTSLARFDEIFDSNVYEPSLAELLIESSFNCSYYSSTLQSTQGSLVTGKALASAKEVTTSSLRSNTNYRSLATVGQCASYWNDINSEGKCTHTDCYVGTAGNPDDCFNCYKEDGCANGCTVQAGIVFDESLLHFNFTEPCCHHDFCYASIDSKRVCDIALMNNMWKQCPSDTWKFKYISGLIDTTVLKDSCRLTSAIVYASVVLGGNSTYNAAQENQRKHNEQDVCSLPCNTTQRQGGNGTTTFSMNMVAYQGTFNIWYDMFGVPDQVTIFYEGKEIYPNSGFVSNYHTANVTYSGNSSTITVVVVGNPNITTTEWKMNIGCPI